MLALASTSCSDEQRRALGEEDIRDALAGQVQQVLDEHELEPDGDLDCTGDISSAGVATGSCTGTTTTGAPIDGSFDGTADVDDETCTAQLVVEVDGEVIADSTSVDCFDVG